MTTLPLAGSASNVEASHGSSGSSGSSGCSCHEATDAGYPELDARSIPHAVRHGAIFGALDAVGLGGGLILAAPHDPLPLLAQLEQRSPGAFDVSYVERGPDVWRLQLVRQTV